MRQRFPLGTRRLLPYSHRNYRGLSYGEKVRCAGLIDQYRVDPVELDPRVFLTANDRMEFKLRYVVDYKKRRIAEDLLYTRLLDEINGTNGRVASATFLLVETPEIKVTPVESTKGGCA